MNEQVRRYGTRETHTAGWTDERVEILKKLWGEGCSATEIAKELGGGLTRNAVCGKIDRLGLSGRARAKPVAVPAPDKRTADDRRRQSMQAKRLPAMAPKRAPAPKFSTTPLPAEVEAPKAEARVTLLELRETHCRWPLGDPASPSFRFCGGDAPIGEGPYCAFHRGIAYTAPTKRKPMSDADRQNLAQAIARGKAAAALARGQ